MPLPTWPSKLVWEKYRLVFNFTSEIGLNDPITNWSVAAEVVTGVDPAPEEMINRQRQLVGAEVFQWVNGGLPGVVYGFTCTAITQSGEELTQVLRLAITPAPFVVPPLFGVPYSTTVYPVNVTESIESNPVLFDVEWYLAPIDLLDTFVTLTNGSLREPLINYTNWPVEAVDSVITIPGGSLVTPLVSYTNWPFEAIDSVVAITNGTLVAILIQYQNWPFEAVDSNITLTGGSLV